MTKKLIDVTAKIIRKCYSTAALADVAKELGTTIHSNGDIFQALVDAGRARDFADAVELVAAHLQEETDSPAALHAST